MLSEYEMSRLDQPSWDLFMLQVTLYLIIFFSRASPSRKDLTEFVFNFGAFSDDFYAGSCALSLADFVIF